jgi:hypothetical protein
MAAMIPMITTTITSSIKLKALRPALRPRLKRGDVFIWRDIEFLLKRLSELTTFLPWTEWPAPRRGTGSVGPRGVRVHVTGSPASGRSPTAHVTLHRLHRHMT